MLIDYWQFARANKRFLGFGFVMAFLSSPGQTYVIGVFGPEIQAQFGLNAGSWGQTYMIGTLLSAAVITWSGALIDKVDLRWFAAISLLGLGSACLLISTAYSPLVLVIGIFMLRQFGQGLTSHSGLTSMARYHANDRGKAIALAAIGFAFGEALLPLLAVFAITKWGWRDTYFLVGLFVFSAIILVLWLLKGHSQRHAKLTQTRINQTANGDAQAGYTRKQALSESRFYLMLPAMIAPSLILTAMFFFPNEIAKSKGWSNLWVTGNYWLYSIVSVVTTIYSGTLIDRYTARKIMPVFLIPLAIALLVLVPSNQAFFVIPFMIFMGVSSGLYFTGFSALWAELYGAKHLGAIKSLTNAVMVFSSALGPALVGYLLSQNVAFELICILLAVICLFATGMLVVALKVRGRVVH
jgi:MFS family permease